MSHTHWGLCWSIYTLISLWVCCADKSQKGASYSELLPQQLPDPLINGLTVCTSRLHISASLWPSWASHHSSSPQPKQHLGSLCKRYIPKALDILHPHICLSVCVCAKRVVFFTWILSKGHVIPYLCLLCRSKIKMSRCCAFASLELHRLLWDTAKNF